MTGDAGNVQTVVLFVLTGEPGKIFTGKSNMAAAAESLGGTPVEIYYACGVAAGKSAVAIDIGTAAGERVKGG